MVELTNDDLKALTIFEKLTGASATDLLIGEKSVVFLVAKGDMGRAIGPKGAHITRVRNAFSRQVLVFEESSDMEEFLRAIFSPIAIKNINIHEKNNDKTVYVSVDDKDRGAAIGRNGDRIKLHRELILRKFRCNLRLANTR
ncbi:NusA-like transcription termination signal-binding factor [Candidatus Micrarchaeota archaeon CG10_big_fil_rev_8_21_14_0_10_45_29]|nr:MAG: NusA-like transcription termination signal-binding factor [Candidatus Micrarchaeota archaeon CG10_big_fil_rev_8_21_14_0_10_45_29]